MASLLATFSCIDANNLQMIVAKRLFWTRNDCETSKLSSFEAFDDREPFAMTRRQN